MTGLEIIGIILALGFVSMIEICAIVICVNKMIDQKMRTKCDLELKVFREEIEYLGKLLEPFAKAISSYCQPKQKEEPKETAE